MNSREDLNTIKAFIEFISVRRRETDQEREEVNEVVRNICLWAEERFWEDETLKNIGVELPECVGSSAQRTEVWGCSDYDYNLFLKLPGDSWYLGSGGYGGISAANVKLCLADAASFAGVFVDGSSLEKGAAVTIQVELERKTLSVDLVAAIEGEYFVQDPDVGPCLDNLIGLHTWPNRNGDRHQRELFQKIQGQMVISPGKEYDTWERSTAPGAKILINNLNTRFGAGYTMEKELYRVMKGLAKFYWSSNTIEIKSYILLMVFCYEREEYNSNQDWDEVRAPTRLQGLIHRLYRAVVTKRLVPYIEPINDDGGHPRNLLSFLKKKAEFRPAAYVELKRRLKMSRNDPIGTLVMIMSD